MPPLALQDHFQVLHMLLQTMPPLPRVGLLTGAASGLPCRTTSSCCALACSCCARPRRMLRPTRWWQGCSPTRQPALRQSGASAQTRCRPEHCTCRLLQALLSFGPAKLPNDAAICSEARRPAATIVSSSTEAVGAGALLAALVGAYTPHWLEVHAFLRTVRRPLPSAHLLVKYIQHSFALAAVGGRTGPGGGRFRQHPRSQGRGPQNRPPPPAATRHPGRSAGRCGQH